MEREILIRVWNEKNKQMSTLMPIPMLAGYLMAIYPNLGDEKYLQGVGILDKNGTHICEGDVVRHSREGTFVIEWSNIGCDYHGGIGFGMGDEGPDPKDYEVLGNIYQNPELAEV